MTQPLSSLLSDSFDYFASRWSQIAIAALCFALISAVTYGFMARKQFIAMNAMMNERGIDAQEIQQKVNEIGASNVSEEERTQAMEAMMKSVFGSMMNEETGEIDEEKMKDVGIEYMTRVLPSVLLAVFVNMVISFVAGGFYLLFALSHSKSALETIKKLVPILLPLMGVYIWSFLRSFVWIPFLGLLLVIILAPRFFLAPVILIQGKKGVLESVRLSYRGTKGYWGKIVGNALVLGLIFMVFSWLGMMLTGVIGLASPKLGVFAWLFLTQCAMAYWGIFHAKLATSIMTAK